MPIGYSRNNLAQKISRLQGNTQAKLGDQYNQLSSGLRINRPSADPAGLAVSSKLAAESRISNRARLNVDDGISVANSADGAYEAASGVLARMSELAGQSASGVLTSSQRSALSAEFDALHPEVQETERERLIRARLGQGVFKANVRLREARCRVTGTAAVRHLRASHIKPWRASSNMEKLDGANGLLLAPHVDHLFDRGWISFEADGGLLVAPRLEPDLLSQWGIRPGAGTPFDDDQAGYLDYHRTEIFQS